MAGMPPDMPPANIATQPVTFSADGLRLEGVLHAPAERRNAPSAAVVVCHPHPLYGGDMRNNVIVAVCSALAARGIAALRFNFRGVGGSGGSHGGGESEREDVRAAVAFVASQPGLDPARLCLAGYSFGAAVALSTNYAALSAVAAVSPPLSGDRLVALELAYPTLFVFGERDEIAPAHDLERAGIELPERSRVVVVPGADHFWCGFEEILAAEVVAFFQHQTEAG
jgi:uncharacterized protein